MPHAVRLLFGAGAPHPAAAGAAARRRVPGARRRRRPHRAGAGRGADRRGDGPGRRAVLPGRAAPAARGTCERTPMAAGRRARRSGVPRSVASSAAANQVVTDVDLVVEEGDWVAIVGPNGAGKTSLLHAVAGLIPATGALRVGGLDPGDGVPAAGRPRGRADAAAAGGARGDHGAGAGGARTHPAPAALRDRDRRRPGRRRADTATGWSWSSSPTGPRWASPAASCSGSSSAGRWPRSRACCCSTSPRAPSTSVTSRACSTWSTDAAAGRAHGRRRHARPDAGRPVRPPGGAAAPGPGRRRRQPDARCCARSGSPRCTAPGSRCCSATPGPRCSRCGPRR